MSHIKHVPDPWDEFLKLEDVDETVYTAKAGQFVRVNSTPDGLEFTDDVLQKSGGTMTGDLILSGDPTSDLMAATKQYVDGVAQGLDVKESCRVATTASISLSGTQSIDGVSVQVGDRVLVKDQGSGSPDAANGIYVCAAGAWSRSTDADEDDEVTAGMFCFIEEGTTNADTGWVCSTNDDITVGVTAIEFVQFSAAGTYTAGEGITLSGTEFSADWETVAGNISELGAAAVGSSTKVARADHVHPHGDQAGGSLHPAATGSVAGFMSAADKTAFDLLPTIGSGSVTGQTLYWNGSGYVASSVLFNDHTNAEVGINTATPNATLHVNGSFSQVTTTQTGDYVMDTGTNADVGTILHNNTAADNTITLPTPAAGRVYHIKKISGNTFKTTIATQGAETIDGVATYEVNYQYESVTVVCDGSNWFIV